MLASEYKVPGLGGENLENYTKPGQKPTVSTSHCLQIYLYAYPKVLEQETRGLSIVFKTTNVTNMS